MLADKAWWWYLYIIVSHRRRVCFFIWSLVVVRPVVAVGIAWKRRQRRVSYCAVAYRSAGSKHWSRPCGVIVIMAAQVKAIKALPDTGYGDVTVTSRWRGSKQDGQRWGLEKCTMTTRRGGVLSWGSSVYSTIGMDSKLTMIASRNRVIEEWPRLRGQLKNKKNRGLGFGLESQLPGLGL